MFMKRFLKLCIQVILIGLLIAIFGANLIHLNKYLLLGSIIFGIVLAIIIFILYKKNLINTKAIKIISIILLIIGILIRIYLLFTLEFNLKSDFELYYNTALEIANGTNISQAYYLSFNGYVCIYSSIIAIFFKIFTPTILVPLILNIIFQLGTVYFLYKLIKLLNNNNLKFILPALWFVLPTVIEANFLVSTETLFIFLFILTIFYFYKIKGCKEINIKNILKYILLGLLISFSNNIRPVMTIFIIALIIYDILNMKRTKELLFLIIIIGTYSLSNFVFQTYSEYILNEPTRSGALAWSVYYGSNYKYGGYWNLEDGNVIWPLLEKENGSTLLLKASFERYKDMGIIDTSKLMLKKYYKLWTDTNSNFLYLDDITNYNILNDLKTPLDIISYFVTMLILIIIIKNKIIDLRKDNFKTLFIELFTVGYILSNLLIVVNGRYNYPIYILLVLILCNHDYKRSIKLFKN